MTARGETVAGGCTESDRRHFPNRIARRSSRTSSSLITGPRRCPFGSIEGQDCTSGYPDHGLGQDQAIFDNWAAMSATIASAGRSGSRCVQSRFHRPRRVGAQVFLYCHPMDRRSEHRYGLPLCRYLFRARNQHTEQQPPQQFWVTRLPLRFSEGFISDGAKAAANDDLCAAASVRWTAAMLRETLARTSARTETKSGDRLRP